MAGGPRDWTPPGHWDESQKISVPNPRITRVAQPRRGIRSGLYAILSVVFGLTACWLPLSLPASASGYRGWAITTVGLMAVGLAVSAARIRATRGQPAGVVSLLGGALGVVGTVFCLWSVAAFYFSLVPPAPTMDSIFGSSGPDASSVTAPMATMSTAPVDLGARIVAPIPGASVVAPELQLHANVRYVAFALCTGVKASVYVQEQYGGEFGGVPLSLTVGPDGTVSSGNTTFSKLPADMRLEYSAAPDGVFSLTVRDAESNVGVGCDSGSNRVVDR